MGLVWWGRERSNVKRNGDIEMPMPNLAKMVTMESPEYQRQEAERRKAETKALRRHSLERSVRTVLLCPSCGGTVDVHGSRFHEWKQRCWPCQLCGYGQGVEPPELRFQNPLSGIVYREHEWLAYLDGVSTR